MTMDHETEGSLTDQIVEDFLTKLKSRAELSPEIIEALRQLSRENSLKKAEKLEAAIKGNT